MELVCLSLVHDRAHSNKMTVMGDIPSTANMVSSIITDPAPGQDVAANTAFTVKVQVAKLAAGSFTNPANTYYAAPQALNGQGLIIGHTHITIQDLGGSLTPTNAPNADTFAFFKGINDNGNGNGGLEAQVTDGLPAGFYRVCTMASASNHQPVIMPIAQRGAQDDCTKFTVGQGNGGGNNNNTGNTGNNAGGNNGNNQVFRDSSGLKFCSILTYFGVNRVVNKEVNKAVNKEVNRVVRAVKEEAEAAVTVAAPSSVKPSNLLPLPSPPSLYL